MRLEAVVKVGRQCYDAFSVTSAVHVPLFSMETELARSGNGGPTGPRVPLNGLKSRSCLVISNRLFSFPILLEREGSIVS